ncbi:MFS transporter [Jiangella asiatica]|nr:MFS transporter [Jiangella asiatica]
MTAGLGGGVALEWFDWNVYGLMAAFLAPHFFPSDDPVTSMLSALAVFGAGFFARPIGAAILGPIADRISHKRVMLISITTMAVTSLIIAAMPTYDSIGVAASVILLALRLIQGLATGAEAGVANAIAIELAPPGKQGQYLGLISGTFIQAGIFGSSLCAFFVSAAVPDGALSDWAWRIPFLVGGILGVLVVYLRASLPETLIERAMHSKDELDRVQSSTGDVWRALWKVRFALLAVILVIGSVQIANYAWITGLPNLANGSYEENSTWVFAITTGMGIVWIVSAPYIGKLADHIRPSRAFTIMRLLLVPAFFLMLLYSGPGLGVFSLVMVLGGVVVGFNMSLYNFIAVTLMPKAIRTTGVAVGYALGVSIFGGTSSYLLVWLRSIDMFWVFPVYGAIVALISVAVYREAKRRGYVRVGD